MLARFLAVSSLIALNPAFISCAVAQAAPPPKDLTTSGIAQHGIVDASGIWPTTTIDVCWRSKATLYVAEKQLTKDAVTSNLHDNIAGNRYSFGDVWPPCDNVKKARIEIIISDAQAYSNIGYQTSGTGYNRVGVPTKVFLDFTFVKWNANCAKPTYYRTTCIQNIAVHEFMHSIGFLHEQLNPDLPKKDPYCYSIYKGEIANDFHGVDPIIITSYDPDSQVNYCNNIYGRPPKLSLKDITTYKVLVAATLTRTRPTPWGGP